MSPRIRIALGLLLLLVLTPQWAAARVGDVDEPAVCLVCHEPTGAQANEKYVHSVFAAGECSACHNPHASRHAALLADDDRRLCGSCHTDQAAAAQFAAPHAPVARGECTACHDPHASAHADQLHAPLVEQCTQCHADVAQWRQQRFVHAPVADGECGTCHDPHGSEFASLLPGEITATCLSCHDTDAAFFRVHKSRSIATSTCTSCHDPHGSGRKGLMRTNQHAPFASGSCEGCHGTLTDTSSFEVAGVRDLCQQCHRESQEFAASAFHHNLDAEGSCNQCHNPHASNVAALLKSSTTTLCMGCHFGESTHTKPRAAYVTHDGLDCAVCHLPHGADNAKYLVSTDGSFCVPCHEQAHAVSHPVGPDVIVARTGESVTCLSCHQLHGADFKQYLPLDPSRDLCIQCHRR